MTPGTWVKIVGTNIRGRVEDGEVFKGDPYDPRSFIRVSGLPGHVSWVVPAQLVQEDVSPKVHQTAQMITRHLSGLVPSGVDTEAARRRIVATVLREYGISPDGGSQPEPEGSTEA